ncbi:MAG: chitinase [Acidimicrobiales bacterium]|nr:chitinase [Acidimicrobiales bacterium]
MSRRERKAKTNRRRRLSVTRIVVAMAVIAATGMGATTVAKQALERRDRSRSHWFAPYVDVTLTPYFDFQDPIVNPNKDVVLAFVVASPKAACTPSWGGAYDMDEAAGTLDLDRRIARLRERGGDVIVSFGGVANEELAHACTDPDALAKAYGSVVRRYHLTAIDLDLEGASLDDTEGLARRATAIKIVQDQQRKAGSKLDVWLTLPLGLDGLQANGLAAVDSMISNHVSLTGVNVMAMDYGAARDAGTSFVAASMSGIDAAARQVRHSYRQAGASMTLAAAYSKVGVTPMIGQNDYPADRLDTGDARKLFDQATSRGVRRFSMWSLNRDAKCGGNVDPSIADNLCSGVDQDPLEFSSIFSAVGGRATPMADEGDPAAATHQGRAPIAGEVGQSPYAEWRPRREYDMAAKVVWRGQVYESKWWNTGAQPDASVKHEWDSPWRILGPVLEHDAPPVQPPTVPTGTYPEWKQGTIYYPGDRVEHLNVGYRAKWWTRGDDPSVDVDNGWENPWEVVGPPPTVPTTTTTTTPTTPGDPKALKAGPSGVTTTTTTAPKPPTG